MRVGAGAAPAGQVDFVEIFEAHYDDIFRYLARRTLREIAEELASETFLVAYSKRDSFDAERGSAISWLYGIAANLLRNNRRSQQRCAALLTRLEFDYSVDDIGMVESLDAQSRLEHVGEVLRTMRESDRETLLLFAWEELSYAEIASVLEIPIGTVRSRLNRIRKQLAASTAD